jgi:hypothetical protein
MPVPVEKKANRVATVGMALALVGLAGCAGGGGKYSGTWSRDLFSEGTVEMSIGSDGTVKVTLPAGMRWDGKSIEGKVAFKGDTLVWGADNGTFSCDSAAASYVLQTADGKLGVAGVGVDPCGARHAALEGEWSKKS